jgi:hypothetical protein
MTPVTRAASVLLALTLLAGCAAGPAMPTPTPTLTPGAVGDEPEPNDGDPRCEVGYGDPHITLERDHKVRPLGWPQTPPFAVLCILEPVSFYEEVGYYATDPGTKFFDVLWYYEHAFTVGEHGYAPVPGADKVLTGVFGDVSYYIEQQGFDRYRIYWAWDGEYDYEEE